MSDKKLDVPKAGQFPRTEEFDPRELFGPGISPFGESFPPRERSPLLPLPTIDPRTAALRVLRLYVASLTFYRPGGSDKPIDDKPIAFDITPDRFHLGMPDNIEDVKFPSIVVTDGTTSFDSPGFTSQIDESTRDKFGKGTVMSVLFEQKEIITLECWCTKRPELRALMGGLVTALSPTEQMYGIRFLMPEYFNEPVCFSPVDAKYDDLAIEVVKGRRVVKLRIEMRFNVVAPVAYELLKPSVVVETVDEDVALDVEVDP